jgi:hypothetical protein
MHDESRGSRDDAPTVDHLLAAGALLGCQASTRTTWSPEKRLAGAALTAALMTIRNHYGDPAHRERVDEDLAWVASPVDDHPFSFLSLCSIFGLEPAWVRETVERWKREPRDHRVPSRLDQDAA